MSTVFYKKNNLKKKAEMNAKCHKCNYRCVANDQLRFFEKLFLK